MHRALQRQLKRTIGVESIDELIALRARAQAGQPDPALCKLIEALPAFLERIDGTYADFERDLELRSRSLEISSDELTDANRRLRADLDARQRAIASLHGAVAALLHGAQDAPASGDVDIETLSSLVSDLAAQREEERRRLDNLKFALDDHAIVSITDIDGTITYANERFCRISGYRRDQLLGANHRLLRSGRHEPAFYHDMWQTIASGKSWHGEICNRAFDGSEYWVAATIVPMLDADGLPREYIAIRTDITPQKQTERALAVSRDEAQAASRAKSEFLANMSHEIRTPMNGVIGMTDLALDTELSDEQREYLQVVKASATSLLTVINDILDFSKIEAGHLTVENIPFDLRRTVAETMRTMALKAHEKGLEIASEVQAEVPQRVFGDPGRVRQVLVNLIGNAVKFTERGHIYVGIDVQQRDDVFSQLRFTVRDTGIGIAPAAIGRVFEAFSQADGSTTRKFGGTGLGLSICRRLVHLMGGDIHVTSTLGSGSEFVFTVRLGIDHSAPAPKARPDVQGVVALLVDDNDVNRDVLHRMLVRKGLHVHSVADATAAQAWLGSHPAPGLIVSDIQMPDVDGFAFGQWVRSQSSLAQTPVIMLSSSASRGDAQRCRDIGLEAFFPKPVSEDDLFDAIDSLFAAKPPSGPPPLLTRHVLRETLGKLHVLLVEDHPVNQRLATRMLDKWGYSHAVAANGEEALECLNNEHFDVALMDMQMPVMDGLECTRRIRQREADLGLARLHIIAMTANAMAGDRERCIAVGMDDYLAKPIKVPELEGKLSALAAARSASKPALVVAESAASPDSATSLAGYRDGLQHMDVEIGQIMGPAFLESYRADLDAIHSAMKNGDNRTVHRLVHSLKGTLAAFGASELAQRAYAIEVATQGSEVPPNPALVSALTAEVDRLADVIRAWLLDHGEPG